MKLKSKNNAFLIKFSDTESLEKGLWVTALIALLEVAPSLRVEGLNYSKRKGGEVKTPILEIREGNDYLEIGEYRKVSKDVIGVGVSNSFHVSFESLDDYRLSEILPIYSVPVYDLEKDFDKILNRLFDYADEVFPAARRRKVKKSEECVNITYHSNFIRVGNSRIDYDDEKAIKKLLGKKKAPKKEKVVEYSLKNIIVV